jgi:hypothetical protein
LFDLPSGFLEGEVAPFDKFLRSQRPPLAA